MLSPEKLVQLEQQFNSIDQTDIYHGPTRDGIIPYRGQSAESVSRMAVADSQIYPTIDDDALVFKWAFDDGILEKSHLQYNVDVATYLDGNLTLEELKRNHPFANPFYRVFQHMKGTVENPVVTLSPYYERLGFVGHYYFFIRRDSSLYRAYLGEIPLTPELFSHGVSPRMEHESSVLFKEQLSNTDYSTEPRAPRLKSGYDFGWSVPNLIEAIQNKGGEVPAFLIKRKRWIASDYDRDSDDYLLNQEANTQLRKMTYGLSYTVSKGWKRGEKRPFTKYSKMGDGSVWTFQGIFSDEHAFDDYYPENEVVAPIYPPKDMMIQIDSIRFNGSANNLLVPKANLIAIYRYLHFGNHKSPVPTPMVLSEKVPLETYLDRDLPEKYLFRQDPFGYMHLYKYREEMMRRRIISEMPILDPLVSDLEYTEETVSYEDFIGERILGEVPVQLWRELTGLRPYVELFNIRQNVTPEIFIAIAKRLGIRHFPDSGLESVEKNCRAINRVIQELVNMMTESSSSLTLRESVSQRAKERRSAREVSKFGLIKGRETSKIADIDAQNDSSIVRATSPPRVSTGSMRPQQMPMVPAGFSLRPTSSSLLN